MPLAPVDDKGTHLWYEDSGIPWACPNYTTLVLLHGGVFHGAIFKPMIPYALQRGIRLVMVNLRDYPGSTSYSWAELCALRSTKLETQRSILQQRGLEIATFLRWYILNENIPVAPSPQVDHNTCGGGLALLAWSWGVAIAMAFLAQAATLPQQDKWRLGSYLKSIIFLDGSCHALGVPMQAVAGLYHPLLDTRILAKDKGRAFQRWVTAYYAHRIPEIITFPFATLEEVRAGLVQYPSTDSSSEHMDSADRVLYQEHDEVTDSGVAERSQLLHMNFGEAVHREMVQLGMCDASTWPHLQTKLVWCDKSVAEVEVEFIRYRGANHMPHWNEPERTMTLLAKLIR
ncbi:uncharacterized protein B0H18DRAFT_1091783 [Fomitopsis serialis]|uniref:uncharacterized protein n=1 Tax=Fomitopsis serialis TaxID=139415 RepID=UPI0020080F63|nr:uncharacterized protein B0H18DRAFT_1091783 [Neoantrodia serialis]KAH9937691.1 hypothetical protein B0H18DRAFT_1091783 [Neoantrodia serialis]